MNGLSISLYNELSALKFDCTQVVKARVGTDFSSFSWQGSLVLGLSFLCPTLVPRSLGCSASPATLALCEPIRRLFHIVYIRQGSKYLQQIIASKRSTYVRPLECYGFQKPSGILSIV